jgi:hypothetical protein
VTAEMEYVIWSIEHTAWWRPLWIGYTTVLKEAGRYSKQEAARIVANANIYKFHECMIPVEALEGGVPPP